MKNVWLQKASVFACVGNWNGLKDDSGDSGKHFAQGTKLYVAGFIGDNVEVIGMHKASKKYCRLIVPAKRVQNVRVQKVYTPAVLDLLKVDNAFHDKEDAEAKHKRLTK